jgi:hypothetical protein
MEIAACGIIIVNHLLGVGAFASGRDPALSSSWDWNGQV